MAAFPAAKLAALLIKQVSKPIANACKNYAKSSPFFRSYICMPPAQFYHWSEVKMKMWILNLGKPVNIPVLNEQQAIELGASLLGEGLIFAIASLLLIAEYGRQTAKESKKEQARLEEKKALEGTINELYFITQKQGTQINELMRHIYELEGRAVQVPWKSSKRPVDGDDMNGPPPPSAPQVMPPASPKIDKADLNGNGKNSKNINVQNFQQHQVYSPSIVNLGISHLYHNVYRIPVIS